LKVLITGGAGYIGSTIAACCVDNGITPVILDDLSTGLREFTKPYDFYHGDIANTQLLHQVVAEHPDIAAVIHCAAKIVVPESVDHPLDYYENNVAGTLTLLRVMEEVNCKNIIFSSSATVYGDPLRRQEHRCQMLARRPTMGLVLLGVVPDTKTGKR